MRKHCVVVGIKDTEFWKQFTTTSWLILDGGMLLLVSKILNSESNSQLVVGLAILADCCCWYQRYWILKAIHNSNDTFVSMFEVVVGIKDTEFWKQFTTVNCTSTKDECCCWYQRYWILKAIHNIPKAITMYLYVVVGIKDTEFWKQFTTRV